MALVFVAAAFLYQQTFGLVLQIASNDASAGDNGYAVLWRTVPTFLFPGIALIAGVGTYRLGHHKLLSAVCVTVFCGLALEILVTLWIAAGSAII
jgi:hypothetical protein